MAEPAKFVKNSYITKRQFTIYQLLMNRDLTIKDIAKKLGVAENTIYVTRRNVHNILDRAFRTFEVAQELDILDKERVRGLLTEMKDVKLPRDVRRMAAETYVSKAGELADFTEGVKSLNSAIDIYREVLESVSVKYDPVLFADTQRKIGDAHLGLVFYQEEKKNCKDAITAYEEALKVFTEAEFPERHQAIAHNLEILHAFYEGV